MVDPSRTSSVGTHLSQPADPPGAAIVERIVSAAKSGRKFKVYVLIPEVP